ncbi:hypothetical protein SSPO_048080 [Streptomyces antimycoticus]|uniref:Uncharacterized protein n=1 Tax=Streptomyces antimycoticus TaxID=68175 RepID=A0A499UNI5_9ACTN|nr:hypothetical protein SSPO_048080 [Streptomyces antimycoticus]
MAVQPKTFPPREKGKTDRSPIFCVLSAIRFYNGWRAGLFLDGWPGVVPGGLFLGGGPVGT